MRTIPLVLARWAIDKLMVTLETLAAEAAFPLGGLTGHLTLPDTAVSGCRAQYKLDLS